MQLFARARSFSRTNPFGFPMIIFVALIVVRHFAVLLLLNVAGRCTRKFLALGNEHVQSNSYGSTRSYFDDDLSAQFSRRRKSSTGIRQRQTLEKEFITEYINEQMRNAFLLIETALHFDA